jgi:NAD(P)-dependent dehydrogenase (short-subunit alcohol dehydrogenase family)/truncated hemoglobin YjbI
MPHLFRITCILAGLLALAAGGVAAADDSSGQKAVLITGASTGIGRHATEALAAEGYFVYAGARKQKDLDALNAIPNVQGVRLDVTIQEEVDAAVETVRKGGRGLYGLVNNAGVVSGGPLIETDEDDIRWLFDVNVFGVFKVTQAFAPLIIESEGRITTIGSISGIGTWFGGGDYTMSKHAIEAFSDTLALELERFDVKTSVIQPGNYRSNIVKTQVARKGEVTEAQKNSPYADYYTRESSEPDDRSNYKEPDEVTAAIMHTLFDPNPKQRYMVVPDRAEAEWTIGASIRRVAQRNERQEHAFSREELIEMLDNAIAAEHAKDDAAGPSLYERLGAMEGIAQMVNDTIALHHKNPDIAHFFEGIDDEQLAHHVTAFFAAGTGGPANYEVRDVVSAHASMEISDAEYDSAVADVLSAAEANGVDAGARAEVGAILESLRPAVMGTATE